MLTILSSFNSFYSVHPFRKRASFPPITPFIIVAQSTTQTEDGKPVAELNIHSLFLLSS